MKIPRLHATTAKELLSVDRRRFIAGAAAAGAVLLGPATASAGMWEMLQWKKRYEACSNGNPIRCLRSPDCYNVLVAFIQAQLWTLWQGPPADSPHAIAGDIIHFIRHLDYPLQRGACLALLQIDYYAWRQTEHHLAELNVAQRRLLLNQGESAEPGWRSPYPLIRWESDYVLHSAISSISALVRLVTHSREPARRLVGFHWSPRCRNPANLVSMPQPAYPDLTETYDVCVIGSGAGGAVVASRAAQAGHRVLIIEAGEWISPDGLVQRYTNGKGETEIFPARSDEVLMRTYQKSGVHVAGGLGGMLDSKQSSADLLRSQRNKPRVRPQQGINILQARLVGGGPYINNAIHLEMPESAWRNWEGRQPRGVSFADFQQRMRQVLNDLGVNQQATMRHSGVRGWTFVDGARKVGQQVHPLPVAIHEPCTGCGSDNSIDPFGDHTGGLHPYRPNGPNSYLMQALSRPEVRVAYQTQAFRFQVSNSTSPTARATELIVEDRRGIAPGCAGSQRTVRAAKFVLAAGAYASTRILQQTASHCALHIPELGQRLTGNITGPVYAVFDKPLVPGPGDRPEPGVTQCFFVDRILGPDGKTRIPSLENWFHFPCSIAVAVTGWFQQYVSIMRRYNHLALAGVVVPTKVRPQNQIDAAGRMRLDLDDEEFELYLRGLEQIGKIYLAAATPDNGVTIYFGTKAALLDPCGQPVQIRSPEQVEWAIAEIRRRGPAFLNLATAHPMGGNSLGGVVDCETFRVRLHDGKQIENLYVADASLFPAGCEINPQLAVKALAMYAADAVLR